MSTLSFRNISLRGICTVVPESIERTLENPIFDSKKAAIKFAKITGIEEKRKIDSNRTVLDLCIIATEKILEKLKFKREDIDVVIFVTQTPDYGIPNNATIIQDRLGLEKNTMCFDVPLGCSGYVYGLSIMSSILESGQLKTGLLLVGDTLTKQANPKDKSTYPLFGDAASATLIQYSVNSSKSCYKLWTDGSGFDKIIIPHGGYRNRVNEKSMVVIQDENGNQRRPIDTLMDGSEVFNFTISIVPDLIKKFIIENQQEEGDYDYLIMHQANKFINETVRKKLNFGEEKTLYSIEKYGNTSSTTIPLTICSNELKTPSHLLLAGFGVGLSIGLCSVYLEEDFQKILIDESKK